MSDYIQHPQIWKPLQQDDWELLMVRVPAKKAQITKSEYKSLLSQRIEWMLRTWMEQTQETQEQTHSRLTKTLHTLLSYQESPRLTDRETGALLPLWEWMDEWTETFLDRNETLMQKLAVDFPVTLTPIDLQTTQTWLDEHDSISLNDWLATLTQGMTTDLD